MFYDIKWKGKLLVFTWHFKEELEQLGKFEEFVLYALDKGKHKLISKKQRKYNAFCYHKKKMLCLSYAEHEDKIILIHIKPIRRIK